MATAKVRNPRKKFLYSITFANHPINSYLAQKVNLPDVEVEETTHGDINRDVKTAGRVKVGDLVIEKLRTTSGSDTWAHDWLAACQDMLVGGGLVPSQYWETVIVNELAEDGKSILNTHVYDEVWPKKITGLELDRTSSDNTIEHVEFSVGTAESL